MAGTTHFIIDTVEHASQHGASKGHPMELFDVFVHTQPKWINRQKDAPYWHERRTLAHCFGMFFGLLEGDNAMRPSYKLIPKHSKNPETLAGFTFSSCTIQM